MGERYLICGAGGFIGSHMARRLYEEGNFVRTSAGCRAFTSSQVYHSHLTSNLSLTTRSHPASITMNLKAISVNNFSDKK
ncbi:hypothetical protein DRQ23_07075 [bacterium]|nr:MAG: hypothetical protein DRQ23_07075 [bacterium]